MLWQPSQQFGGIAGEQPYVAGVMGFDLRQNLCHAVDVGLAADKADIWKGARFRDQMFAAAESDFEPDFIGWRVEQVSEIGWARAADVERKARQQVFDQIGLVRAEFVTLAPTEKRTMRVRGNAIVGRCIAFRRIAGRDTHRSL